MDPPPYSDLTRMRTKEETHSRMSPCPNRIWYFFFPSLLNADASMHFQRKLFQRLWFFKWLWGVKEGCLAATHATGRVRRVSNRKKKKKRNMKRDTAGFGNGFSFYIHMMVDAVFFGRGRNRLRSAVRHVNETKGSPPPPKEKEAQYYFLKFPFSVCVCVCDRRAPKF